MTAAAAADVFPLRVFHNTMVDACVMTTIDPVTLVGGKEPIRTLARHRRWDRKTWFGTRLVPLGTGTISVSDAIEPAHLSPPSIRDHLMT